jgi:hypothetical protein
MLTLSPARGIRRFAPFLAAASTLLLLVGSCSPNDHVPADCITREQFIELYARLLSQRDAQHRPPPAGARTAPDTLSADQLSKLEDFVRRADLAPATWDRLLTEVRERVRVMEGEVKGKGPSSGE